MSTEKKRNILRCPKCKEKLIQEINYYGSEGGILEFPLFKCPKCKEIRGKNIIKGEIQ